MELNKESIKSQICIFLFLNYAFQQIRVIIYIFLFWILYVSRDQCFLLWNNLIQSFTKNYEKQIHFLFTNPLFIPALLNILQYFQKQDNDSYKIESHDHVNYIKGRSLYFSSNKTYMIIKYCSLLSI